MTKKENEEIVIENEHEKHEQLFGNAVQSNILFFFFSFSSFRKSDIPLNRIPTDSKSNRRTESLSDATKNVRFVNLSTVEICRRCLFPLLRIKISASIRLAHKSEGEGGTSNENIDSRRRDRDRE